MTKITYTLAQDLNKSFQKNLAKPFVDHEFLWSEAILIVDKNIFRINLLFKNYRKPFEDRGKVLTETFLYISDVLGRRLSLANNLKEKPTNMHKLLIAYCQYSDDPLWHNSRIERGFNRQQHNNVVFNDLEIELKRQLKRLGSNYSNISHRRRLEFGAYWFINGETYLEVAEELTLFDILRLAPKLKVTEKSMAELLPPLIRVIESLNTKYGLLRSCGLPPEHWLESKITITQLKELKKLRLEARKLITQGKSTQCSYEKMFNQLIKNVKTYGGFRNFFDFMGSLLGQTMIDIKEEALIDNQLETPENKSINNLLTQLPTDYPNDFNPVLNYVFLSLIVKEKTLHSVDEDGLINDPHFINLVNQHPDYAILSKPKLIRTLQHQLHIIIKKHIGH